MPLRKLAHLTLLALGLLTALAIFSVAQLRFNYNFNDFYPAGDPDLDYYEQYAARFGITGEEIAAPIAELEVRVGCATP